MVGKKGLASIAICLALLVFFVLQNFTLNISISDATYSTRTRETKGLEQKSVGQPKQISCDRYHRNYDICSINGPTVLDPKTSTFFVVGSTNSTPSVERVRPYPRKPEKITMGLIEEVLLISSPSSPRCKVQHKAPALAFTVGEYNQNFFHDFIDVFIPLFITVNSIFPDPDLVLVIFKSSDWWINKYVDLLRRFSKHPIINLNSDTATHCFPSATVGLISHGVMTINPKLVPNSKTFMHFHALLETAYGQKLPSISNRPRARPRLVLASRSGGIGRVILNQAEVKLLAEEVGFEVIVFEPTPRTPLRESYALINSSHAMVGVHGAALTHSLFQRQGSIFMQVIPIGAEKMAEICFGKSARDLGLEYMVYNIGAEESSLTEKYGKDDIVLKGPMALPKKGSSSVKYDLVKFKEYMKIMDIYLTEQNVKLDLVKFKSYLKRAYEKAKIFMDKEG